MKNILLLFVLALLCQNCTYNPPKKAEAKKIVNQAKKNELSGLPLSTIKMPAGFSIDVFAKDVVNARSMCLSPEGTLFVGTRGEGSVYALKDTDGDNKADKKYTLYTDMNMPNGVAVKNGDLYIAEVNRILKVEDIESKLEEPGEPIVVYDQYPTESHHGWKYIAFGPDEKLYVPVGAPCNVCEEEEEIYASITRLDVDNPQPEVVQHGVRNTVGFTWHPESKELWFTDNGRDMMGDDIPACELNHAPEDGMHFGFPYCHQGDLPDPDFGENKNCADYRKPVQKLGAHVAPLGIEFYTGENFPKTYKNQILFAEHGSWNRSKKSGYRVMMVTLDENNQALSYQPFAEGWLNSETDEVWGRPVDLEFMPDGSMLVSDDFADVIYRVSYEL